MGATPGRYTAWAAAAADFSALDTVLQNAIASRTFPGCAALVGNHTGEVLYAKAFGTFTYPEASPPLDPGANPTVQLATLFDLASLTKVTATTSALALLYQRGDLALTTTVASVLGEAYAANGKGPITVLNLLLHNAGYPPDPVPGYWDPAVRARERVGSGRRGRRRQGARGFRGRGSGGTRSHGRVR